MSVTVKSVRHEADKEQCVLEFQLDGSDLVIEREYSDTLDEQSPLFQDIRILTGQTLELDALGENYDPTTLTGRKAWGVIGSRKGSGGKEKPILAALLDQKQILTLAQTIQSGAE